MKRPPFSKGINLADGLLLIAVGAGAWNWSDTARHNQYVVILPPSEHFSAFDWSIARGKAVHLVHSDDISKDDLDPFARALVQAGAEVVCVALTDADGDRDGHRWVPA